MTQDQLKMALEELGHATRADCIQWLSDHGHSPNFDAAITALLVKKEVSFVMGKKKLGSRARIYYLVK